MKSKLESLYLKLFELEKQYGLSLDQLEEYLNIKSEIKRIKKQIKFEII